MCGCVSVLRRWYDDNDSAHRGEKMTSQKEECVLIVFIQLRIHNDNNKHKNQLSKVSYENDVVQCLICHWGGGGS